MATSDGEESAVLEVTSEPKKISSGCSKQESNSCNNSNDSSLIETHNLIQSPSVETISTFQEPDKISGLVLDTGYDIVAEVDNPQKIVEPWGTYVSYRVRTKCTRWDCNEKEYVVRRRYNDFKALRERLWGNSLQVVPPLPSRHTLLAQLDRYSKEFVLQRMLLLNIFIKRMTTHSILTHSEDLKMFLTAPPGEFNNHFKSKASYLSSIPDSLYSLAISNGAPQNPPSCRTRDPEFSTISDYMTSLKEKLEFFHSVSSRINKERSSMAAEMLLLGPILEGWSQTERFNKDTFKNNSKRTKNDSDKRQVILNGNEEFPLGDIINNMAAPFSIVAAEQTKACGEHARTIGGQLQEYVLYVEAARERLRGRDSLQAALEDAQMRLQKPAPPPTAHATMDSCHDKLQCASEALRSDLHGWQRQKKTDLKLLMLEMARRHANSSARALMAWQSVLPHNNKL